MRRFFESEALRIKRGTSELVGNELTFEQEWHALDLQAALKDLGITSTVFQAGKQYKVRLPELHAAETASQPAEQLAEEPPLPTDTPTEILSPSETKAVTATPETSQNIPNFIPKASHPNRVALTPKEKRRRFADLARQEHVQTASELAEDQAQLELSFSPAKAKRKAKRG